MQKTLAIAILVLLLLPVVHAQYEFRFKDDQSNFLQRGSTLFQNLYVDTIIMYGAIFTMFFAIFMQGVKRAGFEKRIGVLLATSLAIICTVPLMQGASAPRFTSGLRNIFGEDVLALLFVGGIAFFIYKMYKALEKSGKKKQTVGDLLNKEVS